MSYFYVEVKRLEQELVSLVNVHFQETVGDKELKLGYRLRPGPCPTTNALRIMAMEVHRFRKQRPAREKRFKIRE